MEETPVRIYSASQLKEWQKCALSAKFKYVDKIDRYSNGSAAHFGSAVHLGIEHLHKGDTVEEAIEVFRNYFDSEEPSYYNRGATYESYMKRGPEMIREYAEKMKWQEIEILGIEHPFVVDLGKFKVRGFVDLLSTFLDRHALIIKDLKTGKRPTKEMLLLDIQFCVDDETEALTRRGWKSRSELVVGEDVLTLNQETGVAEWGPILGLHEFVTENQDLISLEGKAHSSLTTKNHRWPVDHIKNSKCYKGKTGKSFGVEKRVTTSENLKASDRIKCAAPVVNLPQNKVYSDDFVELVAWVWTEGCLRTGHSYVFSQSPTKNPKYNERIRSLLTRLYGPPVVSLHEKRHMNESAWRVSEDSDIDRFYLNKVASSSLISIFDDEKIKVVSASFINSLTQEQLDLYIDVSIYADGWNNNGSRVISQSEKARLDSFQMACSLAGIRTSLRSQRVGGNGAYSGRQFYQLSLKEREPNFLPRPQVKSIINYTGLVWCPETENSTWYARRNGHVYFTGNTLYDIASRQKAFWVGDPDDPEGNPGIENGEELYEHFKDKPRIGVWHDLKKNQVAEVGQREMSDYARLYRLMEQVDRAITYEVFVPRISEDSCTWCDYKDLCPVYDI